MQAVAHANAPRTRLSQSASDQVKSLLKLGALLFLYKSAMVYTNGVDLDVEFVWRANVLVYEPFVVDSPQKVREISFKRYFAHFLL
jgi:hypothetical protein